MRDTIVREDVRRDVGRPSDPDAGENRPANLHEDEGGRERPQPQEIIPDDPPIARMSVVGLVLTPERSMKHEPVDHRHERLGEQQSRYRGAKEHYGRLVRPRLSPGKVAPLAAIV